jgi:NarL family two-component system response regulator LiaR
MGIRVVLIDDNKSMREGLCALLTGLPDIEVVGEGSSGQSGVELAKSLLPDVVVMDVVMPDINGIEATRQIRTEHEFVRVVVVSAHADIRYVQHMLEAGCLRIRAQERGA